MRFHHQNLTDGEQPLWYSGRAWLGSWRVEWHAFDGKLGCTLHVNRHEGFTLCAHALLGSLYLSRGEGGFFGRSHGVSWRGEDWALCIDVGTDDAEWRRDYPWWKKGIRIDFKDLICGRAKCATEKGDPVACVVPMPEGSYDAIATPETATWTYRFGVKRVRKSWWIEIPAGIPFQGKGENSWDCGGDGLFGTGGDTLEAAIGNCVASALRSRHRYGETEATRGRVVYAQQSA